MIEEKYETVTVKKEVFKPDFLFQVFIDINCGVISPEDWQANDDPMPLPDALRDAEECRKLGYPAKVVPN